MNLLPVATYSAEGTEQFKLASVSQMDVLVLHCCITSNPTVYSNKSLLFHSLCESGIWAWLNWVVLVQVSHELSVKISDDLIGLEDLLSSLLTLVGGFSFSLPGLLLKAAHKKAAGFPQRELSDKENEQQGQCCLSPNLDSGMPPFLPFSIGHTDQPEFNVGGNYKRV